MIVWINGAFGAGKTQTVYELHRRWPGSMVYDPENAGYFLRSAIPPTLAKSDFQDYPLWREFNYKLLLWLAREYPGIILVPMTIADPRIFREIVGRLREDGVEVRHFTLTASAATIRKRLRGRGDGSGSWPAQQVERCVQGLAAAEFETHLDTEGRSIEEVAAAIAARLELPLAPDNRSRLRKRWDRVLTQLRHIRWWRA